MENKRNCRSKVILDVDDILLLEIINKNTFDMFTLKEKMFISSKGLIIHIKRMRDLNLLETYKLKFPNHKNKFTKITQKGKEILNLIK